MRRVLLFAVLAAGLAISAACTPTATTRPISRDGTVTGVGSYRLHLDDALGSKIRPLVIVLGGNGEDLASIESLTGLDGYAITHGFTVAYVVSTFQGYTWNAGSPCCDPALSANSDDMSRVTRLIQAVQTRLTGRADAARTYLWGFSSGGMMTFRYSVTPHATRVAAYASVAGPLLTPASQPTRLIHMHATDDGIVPIQGGYGISLPSGAPFGPFPSTYTEANRLPTGSTYTLVTYTGNHGWPTNADDQLWTFDSSFHS